MRWSRGVAHLLGPVDWAALPPAVRGRFTAHAEAMRFTGTGRFEANLAGRVFAAIGLLFGRPLPLRTGEARVDVEVRDDRGGQTWARRYGFARGVEAVVSAKHLGRGGAWLEERAGVLVMRLGLRRLGEALLFESQGFRLRLGPIDIPLPDVLTPGRMRMTHEALTAERFVFTLEARHPWFGVTFRQVCEVADA
jgi:hypothetical protein